VLRYLSNIGLTIAGVVLLVAMGAFWLAWNFPIEPYSDWVRYPVAVILLLYAVMGSLWLLGRIFHGLYSALRHIRAWPQVARTTLVFLKGDSDWAIVIREAMLPIAAAVFLFRAAHGYYVCHFADGCGSMRMMAGADNRTVVLVGMGTVTLAFVAWLRR
jgi:hypothetical protein